MKFLIVGRSGSGKDALAAALEKKGLKKVKTYTTRPRRRPDENGYHFVNASEVEKIDRFAETTVNGYLYFADRKAVEEGDMIIVDPHGVYDILEAMPDTAFGVIYICRDTDTAKAFALNRAADPEKEEAVWKARTERENEDFSRFESEICSDEFKVRYENASFFEPFVNTFEGLGPVEEYAKMLSDEFLVWENTRRFVEYCVANDFFTEVRDGRIRLFGIDGSTRGFDKLVTPDVLVGYFSSNPELSQMLLRRYFGMKPITEF